MTWRVHRLAGVVLVLAIASCGSGPTGFDGFWWASYQDNGGRALWLAAGQGRSGRVWTMAAFPLDFAHTETVANCRNQWAQHGAEVTYTGAPDFIEAQGEVAESRLTVSQGVATLTWKMSQAFEDQATQAWLADHPSADPSLKVHTKLSATGLLPDPNTLDLHLEVLVTDARTGNVLTTEASDWRFHRLGACALSPM